MTKDDALKIINDNYFAANESFLFFLHERDRFCADKFEMLCKAVKTLAGSKEDTLTEKINRCYQNILKEIIYHFNPHDSSQLKDFPKSYTDYLEEFDCALARYYTARK